MSKSKASKGKSPKKNSEISKKIPPKKSMPSKPVVNRAGKRKAKRKSVVVRKQSSYNIVQKGIKDYCLRKYGKRCTRKEVSEIYQGLKLRYADEWKDNKGSITPKKIADEIDQRLSYRKAGSMPTDLKDFEWYFVIDKLMLEDGGFFQPDDVLNFDLSPIGLGTPRGEYVDLEYIYTEEVYPEVREYISDVETTTGLKMSPQPLFVLDEKRSDIDKRIFTWVIDFGQVEGKEEFLPTPEGQKPPKEKKEGKEAKSKSAVTEAVLLEREKTEQMKIQKQLNAMELLKSGAIDQDTFKKLLGL